MRCGRRSLTSLGTAIEPATSSAASVISSRAPPRKDRLDINEAIREVIELSRGQAVKSGVSMRTKLADGLPLIQGDRVELQQVMLNLIVNAIEALGGAGSEFTRIAHHHRSSRIERRARRAKGFGAGIAPGKSRARLRSLVHDEARRFGYWTVDLPFDHRSAWGAIVGHREHTPRRDLSIHVACAPRQYRTGR